MDHLFVVQSVIDYYKYIQRDLYIITVDAEKCFDKLWLEDTLNELYKIGVDVPEVDLIKDMNSNIRAIVRTPTGDTEPIQIETAVRQGTIFGPTLCGVETDKINVIEELNCTLIDSEVNIHNLIYVDDIIAMGSIETVRKIEGSLQQMEIQKKFSFNKEKSEMMMMSFTKKKRSEQPITVRVRQGEIKHVVNSYSCLRNKASIKYLGDIISDKGDSQKKIEHKSKKVNHMVQTIKKYGSEYQVGKLAMCTRLKLLEIIAMPSILYGMETWNIKTQKEHREIEKIQKRLLTGILEVETTTSYWGMISETGLWPILRQIHYKKLMFLHHILNSEDERLAKKVMVNQFNKTHINSWYISLNEEIKQYDINIAPTEIYTYKKSSWKKHVKAKIHEWIEQHIRKKTDTETKLRTLKHSKFERQKYFSETSVGECRQILRMRLHMVKAKMNYKGSFENLICEACKEDVETTEHMLNCKKFREVFSYKGKIDDIISGEIKALVAAASFTKEVEDYKEQFEQWI